MAKGLKVDYKRINQQDAENFWNRLNKNNISEAELEDISEEIVNSEGINDYSDAVHETVGTMFVGDKQITDDFHSAKDKDIFKLSAQAVQRLVDTVDVYKEGTVSSYGKSYKLPKVTEKNKDAILMHFVSNIVAGEAAKGYLDNTVSLKRFATETTRDSEFIIPNVPEVEAAKEKIEKAKTAVKPTIGLGTRFLDISRRNLVWTGLQEEPTKNITTSLMNIIH